MVNADCCTCVKVAFRSAFFSVFFVRRHAFVNGPCSCLFVYPPCMGVHEWSVFAALTEMILLSNFAERSSHPVQYVSIIGLFLSGPCGIAKGCQTFARGSTLAW